MPPVSNNTAVNLNTSSASRVSGVSRSRSGYTVRSGDTMSSIAQRNGVSLNRLVAANPQVSNPNRIYPGQQLNLPQASSAPASSAPEASHASRGRSSTPPSAPVVNGGLSAETLSARSANRSQPTVSYGSSGASVRTLQQQLARKGFNPGAADGAFGQRTLAAVRAFQRDQGIATDGVVGPQTWSRLASAPSRSSRPGGIQDPGRTTGPAGVPGPGASNAQKLQYAMRRAEQLGLRITSTTGGRHAPNSYHYSGRAADVAGTHSQMSQFYREMAQMSPTELFYDPSGGIKHGQNIGAIGGHRDHVHVAF